MSERRNMRVSSSNVFTEAALHLKTRRDQTTNSVVTVAKGESGIPMRNTYGGKGFRTITVGMNR